MFVFEQKYYLSLVINKMLLQSYHTNFLCWVRKCINFFLKICWYQKKNYSKRKKKTKSRKQQTTKKPNFLISIQTNVNNKSDPINKQFVLLPHHLSIFFFFIKQERTEVNLFYEHFSRSSKQKQSRYLK